MERFELVTEGVLTLGKVVRLLEEKFAPEEMQSNAALRLAAMLLDRCSAGSMSRKKLVFKGQHNGDARRVPARTIVLGSELYSLIRCLSCSHHGASTQHGKVKTKF
jgi:hypothetical protein